MRASSLVSSIHTSLDSGVPLFIWGAPGGGKTSLVESVAAERGLELRTVRLAQLDPVDVRGIPSVADGCTRWNAPDWLPTTGGGILFLDEFPQGAPSVQNAFGQLLPGAGGGGRLGDYVLPPEWRIIAAGNGENDRCATNRLPGHIKLRFSHVSLDTDLDDWCKWALSHGVHVPVVAFCRFRPALLHAYNAQSTERAFPSPRTWEYASRILKANPPAEIEYELLSGTVGEGAAAELVAFLRIYRSLPSPDAVLLDPAGAPVPEDPATLYALTGALSRKASDATIDRLCAYADRLPAEFSVLLVRDCIQSCPSAASSAGFIRWASSHADVLI